MKTEHTQAPVAFLPEAAARFEAAVSALAAIGVTPHELCALLLASELAESANDTEVWQSPPDLCDVVQVWTENREECQELARDELFEAAAFLTGFAVYEDEEA